MPDIRLPSVSCSARPSTIEPTPNAAIRPPRSCRHTTDSTMAAPITTSSSRIRSWNSFGARLRQLSLRRVLEHQHVENQQHRVHDADPQRGFDEPHQHRVAIELEQSRQEDEQHRKRQHDVAQRAEDAADRQRATVGAIDRFAEQNHEQLENQNEADAPDEPIGGEDLSHGLRASTAGRRTFLPAAA